MSDYLVRPWAERRAAAIADGFRECSRSELLVVRSDALAHLRRLQAWEAEGGDPAKRPTDKRLDLMFWKIAVARPRSPLTSKGVDPTPPAYSDDPQAMLLRLAQIRPVALLAHQDEIRL